MKHRAAGVTLIEILVALTIVAIFSTLLSGMIVARTRTVKAASNLSLAASIASESLDLAILNPPDAETAQKHLAQKAAKRGWRLDRKTRPSAFHPALLQIDVTVSGHAFSNPLTLTRLVRNEKPHD